jgi:hypothetical protein
MCLIRWLQHQMSYVFIKMIRNFMIVHMNSQCFTYEHLVPDSDICEVFTVHVVKTAAFTVCFMVV